MLAFPFGQVQQHCRPLFRTAHDHRQRILHLRDRMRSLFPDILHPGLANPATRHGGDMRIPELAELLRSGP